MVQHAKAKRTTEAAQRRDGSPCRMEELPKTNRLRVPNRFHPIHHVSRTHQLDPTNRVGGPRGPRLGDGPQQPWILVHNDEIDLKKNNTISREEIVGEATKAFSGYESKNDGKLTASELSGRGV